MTGHQFWIIASMLWLVASHAARPDSAKKQSTWLWFAGAFFLGMFFAEFGVPAP